VGEGDGVEDENWWKRQVGMVQVPVTNTGIIGDVSKRI
jgi:hypothetical protein